MRKLVANSLEQHALFCQCHIIIILPLNDTILHCSNAQTRKKDNTIKKTDWKTKTPQTPSRTEQKKLYQKEWAEER